MNNNIFKSIHPLIYIIYGSMINCSIIELRKKNKKIFLIGMCHVAEDRFYDDVKNFIKKKIARFKKKYIILEEGVRDDNKIKNNLSIFDSFFSGISNRSLIIKQEKDLFSEDFKTINADIDLSEFSKETIVFLTTTNPEVFINCCVNESQKIFNEIIDKRNLRVVVEIFRNLDEHDLIFVPWGDKHLDGIKSMLESQGFKEKNKKSLKPVKIRNHIKEIIKTLLKK